MSDFQKKYQRIYGSAGHGKGCRGYRHDVSDGFVLGEYAADPLCGGAESGAEGSSAKECTAAFPWNMENIHAAPALIVLCIVKGLSGYEPDGSFSTKKGTHWQSFDAGVAAAHFCLAANALKFGTLIMGRYEEDKVKEILSLPENYDVSALIAIGHPAVIPAASERKPLSEVLSVRE